MWIYSTHAATVSTVEGNGICNVNAVLSGYVYHNIGLRASGCKTLSFRAHFGTHIWMLSCSGIAYCANAQAISPSEQVDKVMSDACLRYASCDKRFDGAAVTGSSARDIAFTPARLHARTHRVHLCGRVNKVPARRLSFSPPLCMSTSLPVYLNYVQLTPVGQYRPRPSYPLRFACPCATLQCRRCVGRAHTHIWLLIGAQTAFINGFIIITSVHAPMHHQCAWYRF